MSDRPQIREAGPEEVETIRSLADRTWRACYPGIISPEQIDYMLERMYAAETIRREMSREAICYLLACHPGAGAGGSDGGSPAGFAAFGPGATDHEVFLHKLYVLPETQGRGIGAALLEEVARRAGQRGAGTISLRVNRGNAGAIRVYERAGFERSHEVCEDIGGGFQMDDYVMIKRIAGAGA